jgi:hypothetical protein
VHDVQQLHHCRAIVGDGDGAVLAVDQLVHATRTQRSFHCRSNHFAGIDVADQLWGSLRGISSFLEKDNSRLLRELVISRNKTSTRHTSI